MKTRFTLLMLLLLSVSFQLAAQNCPGGGVIFNTQQEVDDFVSAYAGTCTTITAGLTVQDTVKDLSGLSFLTTINGTVSIMNCHRLKTLAGFENISYIGGDLLIQNNDSLTSISSFGALAAVNRIVISGQDQLTTIADFTNLKKIDGDFTILSNDVLNQIGSFPILDTIAEDFYISLNDSITSLNNFPALEYVDGDFTISAMEHLTTIGATNLNVINGNLHLISLDALSTLSAFDNLNEIDGELRLQNLLSISAIPTFANLSIIDEIYITRTQVSNLNAFVNITDLNILEINNCDSLPTLDGFESLLNATSVSILNNDLITDLTGLGELTNVEGFFVKNNSKITSLDGIGELRVVSNLLHIIDNDDLVDIQGIAALTTNPISLRISDNFELSFCHVTSVCNTIPDPSTFVTISNNDNGCNSVVEVETACNINLPVELLSFDVILEGAMTQLYWSTAVEENNYGFEIQHSLDGVDWEMVGFEYGKGSNAEYSFEHKHPKGGINYYRLKQMDWNGDFSFSIIKSVRLKIEDVQVFPSIVEDDLSIVSDHEGSKELLLFTLDGKQVFNNSFSDANQQIHLAGLPAGAYFGKVIGRGMNHSFKIIKQ